jgi:hypothetical protein
MLRQNAKTKELALACPLCDVEARGGGEADQKLISEKLKKYHVTTSCPEEEQDFNFPYCPIQFPTNVQPWGDHKIWLRPGLRQTRPGHWPLPLPTFLPPF